MKPDRYKEAKRWLTQAKDDIKTASLNHKAKSYNWSCFIAQQASEKAIKAFLIARTGKMERAHSVRELCDIAALIEPEWGKLCEQAAILDRFYIPTRYPDGLPGDIPAHAFFERDAEQAIIIAEEIIQITDRLLKGKE